MEEDIRNSLKINKYAVACSIVASTMSIIFGYDTGRALAGSLLAGRNSDYMGRRYTIVVACVIFMIGSVLMGCSPNYSILLSGRCIAGIAVGYALMVAPVFNSELASPSTRGLLSSLPELGISCGILLGYVANASLAKMALNLGWRLMLGFAALPSLILSLVVLKMPESPRWLVMRSRLLEAETVLLKVSNSKQEALIRLRDIKLAARINEECNDELVKMPARTSRGEGVWRELLFRSSPAIHWILIRAIGLHFFEHAVGIEAVVFYSSVIFESAGVVDKEKLLLATVGVGATKLVFVLVATILLDRVGRRRLLLVSTSGVALNLGSLGFCLTMAEKQVGEKMRWALGLSMARCTGFLGLTAGFLSPCVPSEPRRPSKSRGPRCSPLLSPLPREA